jgi:hypothetical protein
MRQSNVGQGCGGSPVLGPDPRVLHLPTRTGPHVLRKEPGKSEVQTDTASKKVGFDVSATFRGQTSHFNVYYDDDLGGTLGPAIADGILAVCEADLGALAAMFGFIPIPDLPFSVIAVPWSKAQGAYHHSCAATEIYCGVHPDPSIQIPLAQGVLVAEEVEVFEAAQNLGWDCGKSNGEGLSRTLAEELYPILDQYFYTADVWLDSARNDYVTTNFDSDVDAASIGCSVLFLNFLQFMGYSWAEIAQAGAPTLASVYQNLTGLTSAVADFRTVIDAFFPPGIPSGVRTDRPLPVMDPRLIAAVSM